MITGAIKNKVEKIRTDIWAGGITNPLTVIEQLIYLMFIRYFDEKEPEDEEFENTTGEKMPKIFPQSAAGQSMRRSKFKNDDPRRIFDVMSRRVFPAIKSMKYGRLPDFNEKCEPVEIADEPGKTDESTTAFARYMDNAMFLIPPGFCRKSSPVWMTSMNTISQNRTCKATCTSICRANWQPLAGTAGSALPGISAK